MARMRQRRRELCLTQAQLAARAGLGLDTVKQVELGYHPARLSTVAALAEALKLPASELLGLAEK